MIQPYETIAMIRNKPMNTRRSLTVLLDTSFLLMMLEQRRDIEEEMRDLIKGPIGIATLDMVERELQRLGRTRSSKTGGLAGAALELLKSRKYPIFASGVDTPDTDAAIPSFSLTKHKPLALATVARKLRTALAKPGVP